MEAESLIRAEDGKGLAAVDTVSVNRWVVDPRRIMTGNSVH